MWWHGGAGLTERSERGSLSAVATHDVFALACSMDAVMAKDSPRGNDLSKSKDGMLCRKPTLAPPDRQLGFEAWGEKL